MGQAGGLGQVSGLGQSGLGGEARAWESSTGREVGVMGDKGGRGSEVEVKLESEDQGSEN